MLSRLTILKKIPRWVISNSPLSSVSSTNSILINPEIDQPISNSTDFEAKIQFLRNKLHPDSLIRVLQSTSDITSAVKIFKWAALQKRFSHTVETYYWIILKLGIAGKVEEMEGFCQNLVRECFPCVENVLVSLVESFVRHCKLNEAICILVNMISGGFRPRILLFNTVLEALVEEKRGFRDVVFVYKEMVKAGVAPNVDTLNCLLEVLFESKKVDSALDQYRRMNKKGCDPNSKTFEIVIRGLIVNNQVNDAVIILEDMLKLGYLPELSFYTSVIPLLCRENKLEEAMRLFTMMQASNFLPNSCMYNTMIRCLCENLWFDEAVNLLEEMGRSCFIPDNDVLVSVVNRFCMSGKISEASKFLEDNSFLETGPCNELLRGCCNTGEFYMAKGVLEKMCERSIADCDSWNILVRFLCEKAEIRKGFELLGRMVVSSMVPNEATYAALVLGHSRLNKCEDSLRLFSQLRAKCWDLDYVSYSELIEVLCRTKKYLDAIRVFLYMCANGCPLEKPTAFSMLIEGICGNGMVVEAIRLQQMAYNSGAICENATYKSILLGLSRSNKRSELFVFLSQMLVKGCNFDSETYCIVIQGMMVQNRAKDCALTFNNMVNQGLVLDSTTLHNLLQYLANESWLYMIASSVSRLVIDTEVISPEMYNILIKGLWKEGCKNEAKWLLDLMLEKGWVPDTTTHRLFIGSVDREGSDEKMFLSCQNIGIEDGVSDILVEGLGNT